MAGFTKDHLSQAYGRFWLFCLYLLIFLLPKTSLLTFQSFDIERIRWLFNRLTLSVSDDFSIVWHWAYQMTFQSFDIERIRWLFNRLTLSVSDDFSIVWHWAYQMTFQSLDIERIRWRLFVCTKLNTWVVITITGSVHLLVDYFSVNIVEELITYYIRTMHTQPHSSRNSYILDVNIGELFDKMNISIVYMVSRQLY
jgi:hypothetical protein